MNFSNSGVTWKIIKLKSSDYIEFNLMIFKLEDLHLVTQQFPNLLTNNFRLLRRGRKVKVLPL